MTWLSILFTCSLISFGELVTQDFGIFGDVFDTLSSASSIGVKPLELEVLEPNNEEKDDSVLLADEKPFDIAWPVDATALLTRFPDSVFCIAFLTCNEMSWVIKNFEFPA